jgi:hypothetical protein
MKPPMEVHHLTYKNVFTEFLFELVAVCQDCHSRLHADDPVLDEILEHRCCDCRHKADYQDRAWCLMFDVAADEALAEDDQCGPERMQFAPLEMTMGAEVRKIQLPLGDLPKGSRTYRLSVCPPASEGGTYSDRSRGRASLAACHAFSYSALQIGCLKVSTITVTVHLTTQCALSRWIN